jgi:hypothetical protein
MTLSPLAFRLHERFTYEYNFFGSGETESPSGTDSTFETFTPCSRARRLAGAEDH